MSKKMLQVLTIAVIAGFGQLSEVKGFAPIVQMVICKACYNQCMTPGYMATFAAKADENDPVVKEAKTCGASCKSGACKGFSEEQNRDLVLQSFREAKTKTANPGKEELMKRLDEGDAVAAQSAEDSEALANLKAQVEAQKISDAENERLDAELAAAMTKDLNDAKSVK